MGVATHSDYSAYGTFVDAISWVDQQLAAGTPTASLWAVISSGLLE